MPQQEERWSDAAVPSVKYNVNGSSGTYQAVTADHGRLHVLTAAANVRIAGGTGASVSAAGGLVWPAFQPYYFFPYTGRESIGWQVLDSATDVTVAVVDGS